MNLSRYGLLIAPYLFVKYRYPKFPAKGSQGLEQCRIPDPEGSIKIVTLLAHFPLLDIIQ